MSIQRHLPAVLQMIILKLRPHQPGAGLHHLLNGLGLGVDHGGAVVQPQRALVITTDNQTDPLVTTKVHVEVVGVRPLEVGQHRHLLLNNLIFLGLLSQGLGRSLQ